MRGRERRRGTLAIEIHIPRRFLLIAVAVLLSPLAVGDVLHLRSGGTVEGEILEQTEIVYRLRTSLGIVSVPVAAVLRVDPAPSPFAEYDRRREQTPDSPEGQYSLAQWCDSVGMRAEKRKHLLRVIELDPEHAGARGALGYVRINGLWVDGRAAEKSAASQPVASEPASAPADPAKLIAQVQNDWTRRIRAIRMNMLDTGSPRIAADGRKRILEIHDPLAILPLTRVLSDGGRYSRETLVLALSQFPQDEATLNLAAMALADPDEQIRRAVLSELLRRNDPRVIPQFREALLTDSDKLIRRAAIALGKLNAEAAVLDLVEVLTTQRRKVVEVPASVYFDACAQKYQSGSSISLGGFSNVRYRPSIGVAFNPGAFAATTLEERDVTVFRTEVLEALRAITGKDFGFDAEAWRRWYEEQAP
ncbi:MAG: HEAT repeat domain-containing protein [Phycisphaerae bacterium]